MTILKLIFISACALVAGAAALSVVMSWPNPEAIFGSLLFSPLLAVAGWGMIFVITPLVAVMWGVYMFALVRHAWLFVPAGGIVGAVVCLVLLAHGPDLRWRSAVIVGGAVSGLVSNILVVAIGKKSPNQTLEATATAGSV